MDGGRACIHVLNSCSYQAGEGKPLCRDPDGGRDHMGEDGEPWGQEVSLS